MEKQAKKKKKKENKNIIFGLQNDENDPTCSSVV